MRGSSKRNLALQRLGFLHAFSEYEKFFIAISLPSYTNILLIKMDFCKCKGEKMPVKKINTTTAF